MIKVKFLKDAKGSFNGSETKSFKKGDIAELDESHETTIVFLENGFAEERKEKTTNTGRQYKAK